MIHRKTLRFPTLTAPLPLHTTGPGPSCCPSLRLRSAGGRSDSDLHPQAGSPLPALVLQGAPPAERSPTRGAGGIIPKEKTLPRSHLGDLVLLTPHPAEAERQGSSSSRPWPRAAPGLGGAGRGPQAPSGRAKPRQREPRKLRYCCIVLHHARPGGSPRRDKPVEERVRELKGRSSGGSAPRRRLTPSPGRVGTAGRAGGGGRRGVASAGRGRGWDAGPPPPAQLQRGAAGTTPGRILGTARRRVRPCHRRPHSPPAGPQGGHLKIDPPAARSAPTFALGPRRQGVDKRRRRHGGGIAVPGLGPGSCGAQGGSAAASPQSLPPLAPHHPSTNEHPRPELPAPPPPGLCRLPAPTRLPGRWAGGHRRPPALGPRPSSRPSAAAEPAREAAPLGADPTSGSSNSCLSQRRLRSNLRPAALAQSLPGVGSSGRGGRSRDGLGT
ncbi:uncharacterized protein LOC118147173 [Callithrix jacchus]